jgi:hypothetical protein
MSYLKIQQVLLADSMFAEQASVKDTEITMRNGEKAAFPALVVRVYDALRLAGGSAQGSSKNTILATAASLNAGLPVPAVAPAPPSTANPVKQAVKRATKAAAASPKVPQSTTKPIVVHTTRTGAPRSPATATERPVDTYVIHRFQCAVASAQLLAAVYQLFEKDDFPGHEERKRKLDALIDDVEKMSTEFVNLSVKQIIRAQA